MGKVGNAEVSPSTRSAVLAPRKESRGIAPPYRTCSRAEQAAIEGAEGVNVLRTDHCAGRGTGDHGILADFILRTPHSHPVLNRQGQLTDVMTHLRLGTDGVASPLFFALA
jgi:hypothetical protein